MIRIGGVRILREWGFADRRDSRCQGNLKLLKLGDSPLQLHDLSQDIGEHRDVAKDRPEAVADLSAALAQWNAQLAAPLWRRGGGMPMRRALKGLKG